MSIAPWRPAQDPRALAAASKALEVEIAQLAPQLLSSAKPARAAAAAPIPVSSGKTNRHRPDRGGNRKINATIHSIAVTRLRCHTET